MAALPFHSLVTSILMHIQHRPAIPAIFRPIQIITEAAATTTAVGAVRVQTIAIIINILSMTHLISTLEEGYLQLHDFPVAFL